MQLFSGKYISVHEYNRFFRDVTLFLLEHYDLPTYKDSVVILGEYIFKSMRHIRSIYPDKRIIVFQLEHLIDLGWHNNNFLNYISEADEVWEYDVLNSKILKELNIPHKLISFKYTKSIDLNLDIGNRDIDVLFYGFLNHRRLNILEPLQTKNYDSLSIVYAYGIGLDKLDDYIRRSKIILNMHAFDYGRQEQVRLLRPLCNGKMVISEHSTHNHVGSCIIQFSSIDYLHQSIHEYLKNDKYIEFGYNARRKFMEVRDEA